MCMVKFGVLALGLAFPLWTFTAVFGVPVEGQPNVIGPRSVRAAPGEDVILPCHVEPQLDLQDYTIEWSKPDLKPQSEVTFVLLYRYKKEVKSVKSEAYVDRTRLFTESLKSGNVSLQIKGVTVEDQGEYKCLVPLLRSRNRQATIRLEVDPSFAPTETSVDPNNFTTPEPTDQTDRESGRSHPGVWISVLVFSFVLLAALLKLTPAFDITSGI
ncbi:butyrophilin subfamily 3 member A1-like [Xyrichtys novacula]|uniref:Butyrophilin subfamily 3 member A1-like n=1 Tax=Xyrichtys novacula TaxID=13765 RepID=A0AAV1HI32_XYRNO|nr:butyrophilin subfamily 3 member A1-like [Xyrichtys novacula]